MKKICAVIPCFNVEQTIEKVIDGVSQFITVNQIIVVDDGSEDQTASIAKESGAIVLQNGVNRGKGSALKHGFQYACQNHFDAIITLDGDCQHDPVEIPKFIECYIKTNGDIILGNRSGEFSNMPLDRQFSNKMSSLIISLLTGQRIKDSQSGYRLIKTEVLQHVELKSNRYDTESELLVKALMNRYNVYHIPIKTIYNDQQSHIQRFVDTLRFVRIVYLSLIHK